MGASIWRTITFPECTIETGSWVVAAAAAVAGAVVVGPTLECSVHEIIIIIIRLSCKVYLKLKFRDLHTHTHKTKCVHASAQIISEQTGMQVSTVVAFNLLHWNSAKSWIQNKWITSLSLFFSFILLYFGGLVFSVYTIQSHNSNFTNSLENLIACSIYIIRCDCAIYINLRDHT